MADRQAGSPPINLAAIKARLKSRYEHLLIYTEHQDIKDLLAEVERLAAVAHSSHRIIHDESCELAEQVVGTEEATSFAGPGEIDHAASTARVEVRNAREARCTCGANPKLAADPVSPPLTPQPIESRLTSRLMEALRKAITGGIRSSLNDHGAITPSSPLGDVASVSKRVLGQVWAILRDHPDVRVVVGKFSDEQVAQLASCEAECEARSKIIQELRVAAAAHPQELKAAFLTGWRACGFDLDPSLSDEQGWEKYQDYVHEPNALNEVAVSPPTPRTLTVVVNGQPVDVPVGPVPSVIEAAIKQSGQIGAPTTQWELRTRDGDIIPHDIPSDWHLTAEKLLFLNLGLPPITPPTPRLQRTEISELRRWTKKIRAANDLSHAVDIVLELLRRERFWHEYAEHFAGRTPETTSGDPRRASEDTGLVTASGNSTEPPTPRQQETRQSPALRRLITQIPFGNVYHANRYDTDNEHVLMVHDDGHTYDLRFPKSNVDARTPMPFSSLEKLLLALDSRLAIDGSDDTLREGIANALRVENLRLLDVAEAPTPRVGEWQPERELLKRIIDKLDVILLPIVDGMIGFNYARTRATYDGPNLIEEIAEAKRLLGMSLPAPPSMRDSK